MQRLASMKNSRSLGTLTLPPMSLPPLSLLGLQQRRIFGRLGLDHAHRAYLVLGDFRDRILRGDGQLIGALAASPVVRDEDRVGPYRLHHQGAQRTVAATALGPYPVAV